MKRTETTPISIKEASKEDAPAIMELADTHRDELGPIGQHRRWLLQQVEREEIFVAKTGEGKVVGFVSFSHEHVAEPENTTVHYLCTSKEYRGQGVGKLLMDEVATDARIYGKKAIDLKCPAHIPANQFYQGLGFELVSRESNSEDGLVNVWTLPLSPNLL